MSKTGYLLAFAPKTSYFECFMCPGAVKGRPPSRQARYFNGKGKRMKLFCAALLTVGLLGCQTTGEKKVKLESQTDKISYSIGLNIGKNLKRDSLGVNTDALLRGVMDASADSAHRLMTDQEVQETMTTLQQDMRTKQMQNAKAAAEKNRMAGEAFLAENAGKPGVVKLPSGLQYQVIKEGKGKKPTTTSTVTTHYVGKLLDGTEFDNSYKRSEPATFPVTGVPKGWTEALLLMTEGSKWELYIPSSLAYGEAGAGGVIPPDATLIFDIELLSVK
jgi:FKBP-type peptidyl-prolyl cis-trans isomerase FklB